MFNFGLFLCYLALPTPLLMGVLMVIDVLDWPLWAMVALPVALFVAGISLMALDDY